MWVEEYEIRAPQGNSNIASSHSCFKYLGDGRIADGPDYQHFYQYRGTCAERHFTYPLLYSENQVKLCNLSEYIGTDIWVGVYRQKYFLDNSEKVGKRLCVSQYLRIQDCMMIWYHFIEEHTASSMDCKYNNTGYDTFLHVLNNHTFQCRNIVSNKKKTKITNEIL